MGPDRLTVNRDHTEDTSVCPHFHPSKGSHTQNPHVGYNGLVGEVDPAVKPCGPTGRRGPCQTLSLAQGLHLNPSVLIPSPLPFPWNLMGRTEGPGSLGDLPTLALFGLGPSQWPPGPMGTHDCLWDLEWPCRRHGDCVDSTSYSSPALLLPPPGQRELRKKQNQP